MTFLKSHFETGTIFAEKFARRRAKFLKMLLFTLKCELGNGSDPFQRTYC